MDTGDLRRRLRAITAELWRVTGPPPKLSRWAWAADAVLALVLTIASVDAAINRGDEQAPVEVSPADRFPAPPELPGLRPPAPWERSEVTGWPLALVALTALPLLTRRRYPLASLWVIVAATQALQRELPTLDLTPALVCFAIAAYSAALYSRRRVLAIGSVVVGAALVVSVDSENAPAPGYAMFLLLCAVSLIANAIHTWKQRALALQREQEAVAGLAVQRERARLAGELHDVVSHNVSMMVVQAGAARTVLDTAPELAREALLAVESSGRAAMVELRHVMGLLTMDGDGPGLAPTPGLDQLEVLADGVRRAGVPVGLVQTGTRVPLPAGVELAAYRVVQEALTNTVKHAVGASVTVTVEHAPDALRVEVTDTGGTGAARADHGSGRGLAGLRERLDVHGGSLAAGPTGTGGFRVRAVIPTGNS
ncbi:two-component sensor histidine kinase [Dactylosporangium aurantiacum]|uniref:histidine kinase n=1 Tax=Dactylosporangium aurantiacum TaxID=35754 RepID=A0A9Q9ICB8_9ACTN|nr:histidine kinase [Dactylosporangium aurantiacum]MDG6107911.1 histidine kinase [Dactylosporangium aurantiacum]UWZ51785.1 two-component sensor histidine kinase [Dactylosporangium aurantiacum]